MNLEELNKMDLNEILDKVIQIENDRKIVNQILIDHLLQMEDSQAALDIFMEYKPNLDVDAMLKIYKKLPMVENVNVEPNNISLND